MAIAMNYDKILLAMYKRRMSRRSLAKKLGISPATVSRKLNGKVDFTVSESQRICEILQLNPNEIFFAISVPNRQHKRKKESPYE